MGWVSALISQRTFRIWGLAAVLVVAMAAIAGGIAFGTTTGPNPCTNTATLDGSAFEIDADANQVVNSTNCIDWLTASGAVIKQDTASGSGDESFGEGTKEDTALPTVVSGSIPPNKSDLKAFGVYTESGQVRTGNPTGKFLELLWTRVQEPSGTTNMDFELNQKFCDRTKPPNPTTNPCAPNNITPLRTTGDKLITYDLSKGGNVATISIRTWNGSAWGDPTVLTGASAQARGTVNASSISASNSLTSLGALSPRTFGEASISFGALFGNSTQCGSFGSAYLKSRSSDSFTAALKDFVPPQAVTISNCSTLSTTPNPSSGTVGVTLNDSATLSGAVNPTGNIVFKLFAPGDTNCTGTPLLTETRPISSSGTASTAIGHPTTQVGTYRWTASYAGDGTNSNASSGCQAEQVTISPAGPAITTTPDPSEGTVGDTLNDSADLTGGVNPQGNIEFKLFAPGNEDCSGEPVFSDTVPVNGNATYNTTNGYTSDATGIYRWTATYTSSNTNNSNASSGCQDELVTIGAAAATIETAQELFPQDSATISANDGGAPTGTVDFALYGPNDANCSGTPVFTQENVDLTNGTANTNNTDFSVDEASSGNYKWIVHYDGDATHDEATSECGKEAFTATIDNDTSP